MGLSAGRYVFFLALLFACGYANAGSIAKRQTDDTSSLLEIIELVIDTIDQLPFIGPQVANGLQTVVNIYQAIEVLTNGAISKLITGILPCEISLQGISCTGLSSDALTTLLISTIDDIPSMILPDGIKSILTLVIQMFINPIIQVLFGSGS